jgi:hypothetical protein
VWYFFIDQTSPLTFPISSYWTWAILFFLIICGQLLGVIEKFWIRVRDLLSFDISILF